MPFLAAGLPSLWSSREAFITLSTQSYKCSALAPLLPILLVAEGDPVRFLSVCSPAVVGGGGGGREEWVSRFAMMSLMFTTE